MTLDPLNPDSDATDEVALSADQVSALRAALRTGPAGGLSASDRPPSPGDCPSLETLAAFSDGRLDASARATVETHLADCGDCLAACRLAVTITAEDAAGRLVPPGLDVVAAAVALVPASSEMVSEAAPDIMVLGAWRVVGRWAMATAATIAICIAGYHVGNATSGVRPSATDPLLSEMTFGVLEVESADDVFFDAFTQVSEVPS